MEKEKRQRITMPQMVLCPSPSGSECDDVKVKGDVGRMVDSSQADDRRLIRLVRERRLLYARNNMPVASFYTQVKALWDEVAVAMGWTVADVRRKWSHIRNSYSRHLRNEMHGACTSKGRMVSRWYLADELEFLREHMATDISKKTRDKKGLFLRKNNTEEQVQRSSPYSSYAPTLLEMDLNETSNSEPVDVKPFIHSPWFALNSPHSPKFETKPPSVQNDDSSSSFAPDENSSYFQFFRGIHNDYLELPPKKQRLFKRKSLFLLHELLDDEEGQQTSYDNSVLNLSNSAQSDEVKEQKPHIEENFILPNN